MRRLYLFWLLAAVLFCVAGFGCTSSEPGAGKNPTIPTLKQIPPAGVPKPE